jgi:hypothetical protein
MCLDETALSSQYLRTLCYTVSYHSSRRDTPSELHTFKKCVMQATQLTALTLNIHSTDSAAHYVPGPLNLRFEEDGMFPALEDLTFGQRCYN